jgi:excisionase family DNA binding protein
MAGACELLQVDASTLRRAIRKGQIPGAFKLGSDWRFNIEQLNWLGKTWSGRPTRGKLSGPATAEVQP